MLEKNAPQKAPSTLDKLLSMVFVASSVLGMFLIALVPFVYILTAMIPDFDSGVGLYFTILPTAMILIAIGVSGLLYLNSCEWHRYYISQGKVGVKNNSGELCKMMATAMISVLEKAIAKGSAGD